jgi:REP element-mobilizing transposase RayT
MDTNSIPVIVRAFKSAVTKRINNLRQTSGQSVWQRNYYEHIIASERDYEKISDYILFNPLNWNKDQEYIAG